MKNQLSLLMQKETLFILVLLVVGLAIITSAIYTSVADMTVPLASGDPIWLPDSATGKPIVEMGVVSRYPPSVIYKGYQPIMDYLTRTTPYHFVLRLNTSYQQTTELLASGHIAAAFFGSYIYVQTRERYGIRCILKPLNENGQPLSHAVVIVRSDSPLRSIEDLRGKKVAFPSEESFAGNWLPRYELQQHHIAISDLDSVRHFPHHQSVVYSVLKGTFDAGVVKERVAREFTERGIRILYTSQAIPGSPLVVSPSCPENIQRAIVTALLKINGRDPNDRAIVREWDPEFQNGFTNAVDKDYDAVRTILQAVKEGR